MKVDPCRTDGHWVWLGAKTKQGYGTFTPATGISVMADHFGYELAGGIIPDGLDLDHVCRWPPCVNPADLEPVTRSENMLRAQPYRKNKDHCRNGHAYTPDNVYHYEGHRLCKTCRRNYFLRISQKTIACFARPADT